VGVAYFNVFIYNIFNDLTFKDSVMASLPASYLEVYEVGKMKEVLNLNYMIIRFLLGKVLYNYLCKNRFGKN
jgi:hypothetical protein